MFQDIYPHSFDNTFSTVAAIDAESFVFFFRQNELLLKHTDRGLEFPRKKDLSEVSSDFVFLFTLNNTPCYLVWDCKFLEKSNFSFHEIKFRNPFQQREIDWASGVALQLKNWYKQNKFCGKCGAATVRKKDERAVLCPSCENTLYPSISPAIIVAILCNDKILLARGARFPEGFFSLVAGYVDVGESLEEAVAREVREEVGLEIKNIKYVCSEPWPFSGSMMIGFVAEAIENQTIKIDNKEIVEANWFGHNNLPNHPPTRSISGEIIEKFKKGEL